MIRRISVENISKQQNISFSHRAKQEDGAQNPNFKGLGAVALAAIQTCERMPMVNVAVIDMLSAILPRTIVESMTNWFAGFEALRRESSGLIVNCLIPGFITSGIAMCLNPAFMPKAAKEGAKRANMSKCWADKDLIQKAADYYNNSVAKDKTEDSLKKILENIEGYERKNRIIFKDALEEKEIARYAKELAEISRKDIENSEMRKEVKKIAQEIVKKTHVADHIQTDGVSASTVQSLLEDSVKFFREYNIAKDSTSMSDFAKKCKSLVRTKSLLGLAVVLPLAASMQYINRWITGKLSGTKGAPIYDDFAKGKDNIEESPKAKEGLLKQKFISISSMIGVALLSMTKLPTWKMLDFKGIFPTMDQARIISTTTFASRMAAADDKNELAEATVRDIATFASLYYLGDVASKGAANIIQNKTGVALLNDTKPLNGDENVFQKFKHWMKDVNIKSSDEVVSATEIKLKGAKPTVEQAETIKKELKRAVNLRSACQYTNIGVSLALLGLIIPIFTRRKTKRNHEQALKLAQQDNTQTEIQDEKSARITPLNIKYSKLTAGFRADKQVQTA